MMASRGRGIRAKKIETPRPRRIRSQDDQETKSSHVNVVDVERRMLDIIVKKLKDGAITESEAFSLNRTIKNSGLQLNTESKEYFSGVLMIIRNALQRGDSSRLVQLYLLEALETALHLWKTDKALSSYYEKKLKDLSNNKNEAGADSLHTTSAGTRKVNPVDGAEINGPASARQPSGDITQNKVAKEQGQVNTATSLARQRPLLERYHSEPGQQLDRHLSRDSKVDSDDLKPGFNTAPSPSLSNRRSGPSLKPSTPEKRVSFKEVVISPTEGATVRCAGDTTPVKGLDADALPCRNGSHSDTTLAYTITIGEDKLTLQCANEELLKKSLRVLRDHFFATDTKHSLGVRQEKNQDVNNNRDQLPAKSTSMLSRSQVSQEIRRHDSGPGVAVPISSAAETALGMGEPAPGVGDPAPGVADPAATPFPDEEWSEDEEEGATGANGTCRRFTATSTPAPEETLQDDSAPPSQGEHSIDLENLVRDAMENSHDFSGASLRTKSMSCSSAEDWRSRTQDEDLESTSSRGSSSEAATDWALARQRLQRRFSGGGGVDKYGYQQPANVLRLPLGPLACPEEIWVAEGAGDASPTSVSGRRRLFAATSRVFHEQKALADRRRRKMLHYGQNFLLACAKSPVARHPPEDWHELTRILPGVCLDKVERYFDPDGSLPSSPSSP